MKRIILVFMLLLTLTLTSCGKKYLVTFDTAGGSPIEAVEVKKNDKVERPTNPTLDGYKFVEWQLNGETFDFDTKIKEDITLVAIWKATSPSALAAPKNVVINGNTISWNAVAGATEYEVYIDGEKQTTKNASLSYDFSKSPLSAVYVVAKNGNTLSTKSEIAIYEHQYTNEEIYNILESHASITAINEYPELFNTCAQLVKKYNFDMDVFYGDVPSNIYELVKNGNPVDLLCGTIILGQKILEYNEDYHISMPNKNENILLGTCQKIYNDMKSKGLLENAPEDFASHDKFTLFIAPCMMYSHDFDNYKIDTAEEIIMEVLEDGYNNLEITKTEQGYLVTRTALNKQMLFTETELVAYLNYFSQLFDSPSGSWQYVYQTARAAQSYVENLELYENFKKLSAENQKLYYEVLAQTDIDKETLNQVILDLLDAYEVVLGYKTKIEQLMTDFKNADNENKINLLVEDAKNFSVQVADLIQDCLPSEAEVKKLLELVEYGKTLIHMVHSDYTLVFLDYILNFEKTLTILEAGLNDSFELVNSFLNIVENIKTSELKAALDFATNLNVEVPTEIVDLVKSLFNQVKNVVEDFEFSNGLITMDLVKLVNIFSIGNGGGDILGLFEYCAGYKLTQKELDLLLTDAYDIIDYVLEYDFDRIIDLLAKRNLSVEYYNLLLLELDSFAGYCLDYIDDDFIKHYEQYVLDALTNMGLDHNYYQVIINNLDGLKTYARVNVVCQYMNDLAYEMSTNRYDVFRVQFNYLKRLSNEDITKMSNSYVNIAMKFNEDLEPGYYDEQTNNPLITDFQNSMSQLEKIMHKQQWELTENEIKLVFYYNACFVFEEHIDWRYPGVVDVQFDNTNECIVMTIKEDCQDRYVFWTSDPEYSIKVVRDNFDVTRHDLPIKVVDNQLFIAYSDIENIFDSYREECVKIYIYDTYNIKFLDLKQSSENNFYYYYDHSLVGLDLSFLLK